MEIEDWEQENNRQFLIAGVQFFEFCRVQWEEYKTSKELQKQQRVDIIKLHSIKVIVTLLRYGISYGSSFCEKPSYAILINLLWPVRTADAGKIILRKVLFY